MTLPVLRSLFFPTATNYSNCLYILHILLYSYTHHLQLVWDGGYDRPMGLHGGYEEGMGQGTDHHTLTQTHHSWVWVRNLFSQSKMVNIVIILNIIDTHTTTQDNPYPSLRVWVCMGMGMGRGENTHGLHMSHTRWARWQANWVRKHRSLHPPSVSGPVSWSVELDILYYLWIYYHISIYLAQL